MTAECLEHVLQRARFAASVRATEQSLWEMRTGRTSALLDDALRVEYAAEMALAILTPRFMPSFEALAAAQGVLNLRSTPDPEPPDAR